MKQAENVTRIHLRKTYDARFKAAIFRAVEDQISHYDKLSDFIATDLRPALKEGIGHFYDENDRLLDHAIALRDNPAERKALERYLEAKGQVSNELLVQRFHAFLHERRPDRAANLDPNRATDTIGKIFGIFLRDPTLHQAPYELAVEGQRILGLYQYDAKDIGGQAIGDTRYLAFLAGATPDYLFCADFYFRQHQIVQGDEHLRLQYGFCVPGNEFSPLILRTHKHRERVAGLLYTPNALSDFKSDVLKDLRMDVFTTDKSQFGASYGDHLDAAIRVWNGPRIQVVLKRVENARNIRMLNERIAQLRREYL